MEAKVIKKMSRFVELSCKFSLHLSNIVDKKDYELDDTLYVSFSGTDERSTTISLSPSSDIELKEKTIPQRIVEKATLKALFVEEYLEFCKLRDDLQQYFKSLKKLTKND